VVTLFGHAARVIARCVLLGLMLVSCAETKPVSRRTGPKPRIGLPGPNAPTPTRVRIHAIDVGQGSAALLEFPCAAVLVDTGGENSLHFDSVRALKAYLEGFFARRTDLNRTFAAVFITHPHIDHTRGLGMVMKDFTVQQLITNGRPRGVDGLVHESGGDQQEKAEKLMEGRGLLRRVSRSEVVGSEGVTDEHIDPVSCPDLDPKISVLWGGMDKNVEAWEPRVFNNANNHSVVVKVEVDGHPILITGDLETEAITSLLAAHGALLNSDVYFVGHHGSHNGTTMALMKAVTPCTAVVSMGPYDRQEEWTAWAYGHPRKKTVDIVTTALGCSRATKSVEVATRPREFEPMEENRALYGTGWEGTIIVELSDKGGWRSSTER